MISIPRLKSREWPATLDFTPIQCPAFTIAPARYAKGMCAVTCPSRDGYKSRAARLASSICKDRYSGREGAYILSPAQAERFYDLYAKGWDGGFMGHALQPPTESAP